jgi:hypothetical protein
VDERWHIWMRLSPDEGWMQPAIAGVPPGMGFDSKDDAELIADQLLEIAEPGVAVAVLPEGMWPADSEPGSSAGA